MNLQKIFSIGLTTILVYLLIQIDFNFLYPNISTGVTSQIEPGTQDHNSKKISTAVDLVNSEKKSNTLYFVGDVMLARNVEVLMNRNSNDYPFLGFDFNNFDLNPYVIGNFESAIPVNHVPTLANKLNFSVKKSFLPAAKKYGFTHFSLANNHSFDFGESDFVNTNSSLTETGIVSFGHPYKLDSDSIALIELQNKTVAIIAIQAMDNQVDNDQLKSVFSKSNSISDIQIVYIHWGVEYESKHSQSQEKLAKLLVSAGADLIVGHHPHVVQDIDYIDGVPIFYSLGNYIFDQYFSADTQEGLVLRLDFESGADIDLIPVTSVGSKSQPKIMDFSKRNNFLQRIASLSDNKLVKYIEQGRLSLDMSFATSSEVAIMGQ